MKLAPNLKKATENMKEGVLSAEGFLGNETLNLADIIERDEEEMRNLGLDFDKSADKLEELLRAGSLGLGEPITIEDKWLVQTYEAKGGLPCPFEDGLYEKITATIINKENKIKVSVSELSIHLLKVHHFCQGRGSIFRIDPKVIKKVLYE